MTFEMGAFVAFVTAIVAASVGYGKLQGRMDAMDEKIKPFEECRATHEKTTETTRSMYDSRMTAFEVRLGRGEEKFEQISRDIGDIKKDVRTLLTRRRDDRDIPNDAT